MKLERFKIKQTIVISALLLIATSVNAEKKEITEEDIDKAIESLNSRIESFPNEEPDYPRFTRVALDYSYLNGNVNDQRQTDFFGGPFADGSNDSKIFRASTNIQLSKNFSAGLSIGMIDGDSSIQQGDAPQNIVSSDSDGTTFGASLRYQINDWLAAGIFAGWSSGDGSSVDTFGPPANTGTFKFTGQTQGAYLSATKAISDQWVYSISPSFTHSKSKSKYYNDAPAETITNYELNMWHVDQNISYYFDKYRARLTGGYTYHNVAHETATNSAPRSNSSGTVYVGGSYLVSVSHGVELYGIGSKDYGDDVYDEASSLTFGIAKNF